MCKQCRWIIDCLIRIIWITVIILHIGFIQYLEIFFEFVKIYLTNWNHYISSTYSLVLLFFFLFLFGFFNILLFLFFFLVFLLLFFHTLFNSFFFAHFHFVIIICFIWILFFICIHPFTIWFYVHFLSNQHWNCILFSFTLLFLFQNFSFNSSLCSRNHFLLIKIFIFFTFL